MATNQDFPTTDRYKLGANVQIEALAVVESFQRAARGEPSKDGYLGMIQAATGRKDLKVTNNPDGKTAYSPENDSLNVSGSDTTIASLLNVTQDNLPPNIPKVFTPELVTQLAALHEAEHVTQIASLHDPKTGEVISGSQYASIIKDNPKVTPDQDSEMTRIGNLKVNPDTLALEVDADLPVVESLKDMGYEDGAQFWLDMRNVSAVTRHFPFEKKAVFEHDVGPAVSHFERTGEVLDTSVIMNERQKLVRAIKAEMSADPAVVSMDYPGLYGAKAMRYIESKEGQEALMVRPQVVLSATKTLLEKGELSPLQAKLAEQYVESAERMGYNPEISDYNAQMRHVFENNMGLKPAQDTSQPNDLVLPRSKNP